MAKNKKVRAGQDKILGRYQVCPEAGSSVISYVIDTETGDVIDETMNEELFRQLQFSIKQSN